MSNSAKIAPRTSRHDFSLAGNGNGRTSNICRYVFDLFDICAAVGLNVLRVTSVGSWADCEAGVPDTPEQWRTIGERARATSISLIPVADGKAEYDAVSCGDTPATKQALEEQK